MASPIRDIQRSNTHILLVDHHQIESEPLEELHSLFQTLPITLRHIAKCSVDAA
jgi:hypothetical protein